MTAVTQHQQLESFYADPTVRQPATMQQPETAKNVTVYLNGDKYNPGKRLVVNRKHVQNFDGFLTMVTNGLKPSFGAVRQIYTPNHGHKVTKLDAINSGMAIVAGGSERFRKLAYQEISTKKSQQQKPRADQQIRPVYHSKMNVAARWKEVSRGPCNIYIYGNGDINGAAVKLLLIPRILKSWEMVLQEVTEKIAFKTGQACRRLYTIQGIQVFGSEQLENGRYYVSVGNERFKKLPYGERAQAMAASTKRTQHQLPPLVRRGHTNTGQQIDSTYSQKYAARRQLEEDRAYQSHPPTVAKPSSHRRLRPIRGTPATEPESTVFRGKPMKVKRSSATGKLTQVENDDDVFRAKRKGIVAEEVADDNDTKVDLPIDQVPADVVEEEEYPESSRRKSDGVDDGDYQKTSPEPKQTYAPRIEEDDSDLTAPSKTPTSARRNEPQQTPRTEPSESKPNSKQPSARQSISPTKQVDDELMTKNEAAIVIQSGYRGYRARKAPKSKRKVDADNPESSDATAGEHVVISDNAERQPTPPIAQPTPPPPPEENVSQPTPPPKENVPQPTPPPEDNVSQPTPPPEEIASQPDEQVVEESREMNTVTKESSRPASTEIIPEDKPEDFDERQPSPEEMASQPLVNSKNDEDANSRTSKSPAVGVAPEETELREATPVENITQHDEPSPQTDDILANDTRSPSNLGNDDNVTTTRSDEAAGLPDRDDGDGTDDEKHRNVQSTPNNGSEPEETHEPTVEPQEKSPRSGQLTPADEPVEPRNSEKAESQDGLASNGQNLVTEDAN